MNNMFILPVHTSATAPRSTPMMDLLPEDLHCQVALFLPAPDILNLLSVHRNLQDGVGTSLAFWGLLLSRDSDADDSDNTISSPEISSSAPVSEASAACDSSTVQDHDTRVACVKKAFLARSHTTLLPSVKWCPIKNITRTHQPSAREGHLMCLLGPPSQRKLVLTGGYSDDELVHLLEVHPIATQRNRRWIAVQPTGTTPSFVYGATLTRINDRSALRFGGFQSGGYSGETAECYLLNLEKEEEEELKIRWEKVKTRGHIPMARAYHSATLLNNRYLVIIGGMRSSGCILHEVVLDVQTWTWLHTNSVTDPRAEPKPSPRFGHSVVLDSRRSRLVLFGGGRGTDLLRSGVDNSEVWELKLGNNWKTDLRNSLPWHWSRLHRDSREEDDELEDTDKTGPELSRAERLCLGRCHVGFRISVDTVLLAFGSGNPSTNGALAYNLQTDTFHRPRVDGPLPMPRFTAAAVAYEGWLVVHGGYAANGQGAIGDMVVLDLAPGMKRAFQSLHTANAGDREMARSHRPIRNEDVSYRPDTVATGMIMNLMATRGGQRQDAAAGMLHQLMATGGLGGREAYFLAMVANGNSGFHEDSSTDENTDDQANR